MKKSLSYLSETKKEVILGPLFKMLEVVFELLVPVIVSQIVDRGIADRNVNYIVWMCLILLGFAILGFLSAVVAQYFSAKAAVKLSTRLRKELFDKIQNLQYEDLDEIGTSTLITRMTSDVNQVQNGVNMTLRLLLRSPVVVIGAVIVSFTISVKAGIVFLCTVPTLFLIIFLIMRITVPLFRKSQSRLDTVVELSRENLIGVRVIRAFNQQEKEKADFEDRNGRLMKSQLFVGRLSGLSNPLTYALINIFVIVLIYVGGIEVDSGNLSQGNVIALYNLISQILIEMVKFANLIVTISKSMASANRIDSILELNPGMKSHDHAGGDGENIVEFRDVSMNYRGSDKNALSDISFSVKKGQTVGIIGGTGAGKTTLVHAMNHFYDINRGTIYLEGKDLASFPPREVHEKIALVPQKAKLFQGTIRENLLWGNDGATDEELYRALSLAQADDVIRKKKNGLDEEVEQDGKNFSGGQKQRLCIARALVKKADIVILDDSSSALDYATDARLRKSIRECGENLTTFIISQRTASIRHCDLILVLDNGELVGKGTHEELMKTCRVYQEIHASQYRKEENV